MNQHNEISTLQYMGSKARIISRICDPIIKNNSIKTVVDLFAGTGSVGYALKGYKNIISNDIEYYAYIVVCRIGSRSALMLIVGFLPEADVFPKCHIPTSMHWHCRSRKATHGSLARFRIFLCR